MSMQREVFVRSELVCLAHFISVIANMRHKEKILRSSYFIHAGDPDSPFFSLLKYDRTNSAKANWLRWPQNALNKKIGYCACGLGTDVDQHLFMFHLRLIAQPCSHSHLKSSFKVINCEFRYCCLFLCLFTIIHTSKQSRMSPKSPNNMYHLWL